MRRDGPRGTRASRSRSKRILVVIYQEEQRQLMKLTKSLAPALSAVALIAGGLTFATASVANAATVHPDSCINKTPTSFPDSINAQNISGGTLSLRDQPYQSCDVLTSVGNGGYLHVNCYHMNSESQEWYYATSITGAGWIPASSVAYRAPDQGKTSDPCPGVAGL